MQQAARISDYTAFFLLGEIIELSPLENCSKILAIKEQKITLQEGLVRYDIRQRN